MWLEPGQRRCRCNRTLELSVLRSLPQTRRNWALCCAHCTEQTCGTACVACVQARGDAPCMRQTSMHNAQRHGHANRHHSRSPTHLPHTQCAHTSHPPRPVVWAEQSGVSEITDGEAPVVSNGGAVQGFALGWLRSSTGDERACASRLRQAELRRSKVEGRERERLVAAAAAAASDAEAAERRVRMLCEHWNGTAKRRAVQSAAAHRIATESSIACALLWLTEPPGTCCTGWLWSAQRARELAGNRQPLHLQSSLCHSGTLCSRFCAYGKCRRSPR